MNNIIVNDIYICYQKGGGKKEKVFQYLVHRFEPHFYFYFLLRMH